VGNFTVVYDSKKIHSFTKFAALLCIVLSSSSISSKLVKSCLPNLGSQFLKSILKKLEQNSKSADHCEGCCTNL
jgi:hypothetical protein